MKIEESILLSLFPIDRVVKSGLQPPMHDFIILHQGRIAEGESSDDEDDYIEKFIVLQPVYRNYNGSNGDDGERIVVWSLILIILIGFISAVYVAIP